MYGAKGLGDVYTVSPSTVERRDRGRAALGLRAVDQHCPKAVTLSRPLTAWRLPRRSVSMACKPIRAFRAGH